MTNLVNDDWSTFPHQSQQGYHCQLQRSLRQNRDVNIMKALYSNQKGITPTSSLTRPPPPPPPPQSSRYDNVKLISIDDDHGNKLILRTKAFNSLSTSSLVLPSPVAITVFDITTFRYNHIRL
ncbi:hypothetical protein INT45_004353 [Circinella minor]|uniref:Uncharacterized protein n=1 Tax=Circinella minor TaxID=1195481 RepID=A0A8H7S9K5_9FUNG|nr:hypothetical protein INT45_004353 [Circinella minor]